MGNLAKTELSPCEATDRRSGKDSRSEDQRAKQGERRSGKDRRSERRSDLETSPGPDLIEPV